MTNSPSIEPRRKQWAPRVRTGCRTCRTRRIKCDETQPDCRRCVSSGRTCQYSLVWRPPGDGQPRRQQTVLSTAPFRQAPLPDADIMEAVRYYLRVLVPRYQAWSLTDMHGLEAHSVTLRSRHTFATALLGEGTRALYQEHGVVGRRDALPAIEHTFIMSMLADRIRAICRENGVLPQRDALPGIEPLWHSFQVYMTYTLAALNSELADRFLIRSSLYQIASLMFTGFHIPDLPWRSHIRGFFALVRHHGGFQAVVDSIPQAIFLFHSVAIAVTMANATSPATDQIAQAKEWTETQYSQAYDYSLSDILPCPTTLFLCVGRITNLRVAVANGLSPAALLVSAERTSEKLNLFDPACWTKAFSTVPEPRKVRTVYDTAFKLATILYALLSLPTELSQPFAKMGQKPNPERKEKSKQQQVSEVNQARLHYRKLLFDIVVLGKRRASLVHGCLCWPLAVLGIAYHDGPAETKAAILTVADELRRVPVGSSGPSNILFTLSRFWASGKTRWDECFDTPVHVLL